MYDTISHLLRWDSLARLWETKKCNRNFMPLQTASLRLHSICCQPHSYLKTCVMKQPNTTRHNSPLDLFIHTIAQTVWILQVAMHTLQPENLQHMWLVSKALSSASREWLIPGNHKFLTFHTPQYDYGLSSSSTHGGVYGLCVQVRQAYVIQPGYGVHQVLFYWLQRCSYYGNTSKQFNCANETDRINSKIITTQPAYL